MTTAATMTVKQLEVESRERPKRHARRAGDAPRVARRGSPEELTGWSTREWFMLSPIVELRAQSAQCWTR
jgi:hypothetical protein